MGDSPQTICDVDAKIIEDFLILLRDKYLAADRAIYFLETRAGISGISSGVTNQRDVMTHLLTILRPDLSEAERLEQLGNAEEHLRRATLEPYEIALTAKMQSLTKCFSEYSKVVLPLLPHERLANAPTMDVLRKRLTAIAKVRMDGRATKAENKWNESWEEGVKKTIEAFDSAEHLLDEVQTWIDRAHAIKVDRTGKRFGWAQIVLAFVLGALALLVGHYWLPHT